MSTKLRNKSYVALHAWYLCGWKQWDLDGDNNQPDFPCTSQGLVLQVVTTGKCIDLELMHKYL